MSQSRFAGRVAVVARACALRRRVREAPRVPQRILIAHHLLLGDTLMLTALVAKLRANHPGADIAMTVPRAISPIAPASVVTQGTRANIACNSACGTPSFA